LVADFRARSQKAGRPWIIVVSSDHGEMLGDHGYFRKCEPYEGSAHIPLIVAASPSLGCKPGVRSLRPVCLEDIMPTLLELCGVERPAGLDGVSLLPVLRGEDRPLREWLHKQRTGRPHVTWKFATSIDGRSAAADGSSRWITSEAARADLHRRRAAADAIVVGTGTVFTDDPTLTARLPDGSLAADQPLRVVVGLRQVPPESQVCNDDSRTLMLHTRDPHEVIEALRDRTDVLLEGGPILAGAFLRAGIVDRILAYVAPILLGGPFAAVDDVGVAGIAGALRWRYDSIESIGPDLLLSLVPPD
jgi:riboflavin biosynthesis pyrimidine reductase